MAWTFSDWYSANKEAFNDKRRTRYHSDPEYRAKVLEQNAKSRAKRKKKAKKHASRQKGGDG